MSYSNSEVLKKWISNLSVQVGEYDPHKRWPQRRYIYYVGWAPYHTLPPTFPLLLYYQSKPQSSPLLIGNPLSANIKYLPLRYGPL